MTRTDTIEDLQILRGAGTVAVLLAHFTVLTVLVGMLPWRTSQGPEIGVGLFFVISGFVTTRSLVRREYDPLTFAVRRAYRLYPTLFVFLVASGVLDAAVRVTGRPQWVLEQWTIPFATFLEQAVTVVSGAVSYGDPRIGYMNSTMWILSVELQFYAAVAVLALVGAGARLSPRMMGGVFVAAAAGLYIAAVTSRIATALGRTEAGGAWFGQGFEFLALGVLLAFVPDRGLARLRRAGAATLVAWLVAIVFTSLWRAVPSATSAGLNHRDGIEGLVIGLCLAALVALGAAGAVSAVLPRRLSRILAAVGDRGYTIYALHLPCMVVAWIVVAAVNEAWVRDVRAYAIPQVVATLVFLAPLTELVYRRVDRRFVERGRARVAGWSGLPRARRAVASTAGAVLVVSVATLGLAEAGLRIYQRIHPLPIFYSNAYNRFRGQPFAQDFDFRLNSRGFKDVEFETRKPDGTFRILGIGDSFAFGVVPYADNYLTLLEEHLAGRGHKVEVLNMGIPGIGPEDYLALLVREGLELHPDLVLVSFFIGNDFILREEARSLISYSYVATAIKYAIDVRTKVPGQIVHGNIAYDDDRPTFSDSAYLDLLRDRSGIFATQDPRFAGALARAVSDVVAMRDICERLGIRFMAVLIPDEVQIEGSLRRKVIETPGPGAGTLDFDLPNDRLHGELARRGVEYLDLLEDLRYSSTQARLYKPSDSHWNVKGNAVAADLIERYLLEHAAPFRSK